MVLVAGCATGGSGAGTDQGMGVGGPAVVQIGGAIYTGISPEAFKNLATELGVTKAALGTFLKTLIDRNVSPEDYDRELHRIARRYRELKEELRSSMANDPEVGQLKRKAADALDEGRNDLAEALLRAAKDEDVNAAKRAEAVVKSRLRSAAATMYQLGALKANEFDYVKATSAYREALALLPIEDDDTRSEYLWTFGHLLHYMGNYTDSNIALEESLVIGDRIGKKQVPGIRGALADLRESEGRYAEAEAFRQQNINHYIAEYGEEHPITLWMKVRHAKFLQKLGREKEAEYLLLWVKSVWEKKSSVKLTHEGEAYVLKELGSLYEAEDRFIEAVPLFERSLALQDKIGDPFWIETLVELAKIYGGQGQYGKAEAAYQMALLSIEGEANVQKAGVLGGLGWLHSIQGLNTEATLYYERAEQVLANQYGPDDPRLAAVLGQQGDMYFALGRFSTSGALFKYATSVFRQAESLYKKRITILGKSAIRIPRLEVGNLHDLGAIYLWMGSYADAESTLRRALEIGEKAFAADSEELSATLDALGTVYMKQSRYAEAKSVLERGLKIAQQKVTKEDISVSRMLSNLADIYFELGLYAQAESAYHRALAIQEANVGRDHLSVSYSLHGLGLLRYRDGRYAEAEDYHRRELLIREMHDAPGFLLSGTLWRLGNVLVKQMHYAEAEIFYHRALVLIQNNYGEDATEVADILQDYAVLLEVVKRDRDADRMKDKIATIRQKKALSRMN